jgi:hypothetical protein
VTRTGGRAGRRPATAARRDGSGAPPPDDLWLGQPPNPQVQSQRPSGHRSRSRWRRGFGRTPVPGLALVLKVLSVTLFTLALAGALVYARLLHGPISLSFLVPPIERGIAEEFPGIDVRIEDVAVRLTQAGNVRFELRDVRIADALGTPLALAPSAAVALSPRALLRGRIAAESIDLIAPRLRLFLDDSGKLSVSFSPQPADAEPTPTARSAAQALGQANHAPSLEPPAPKTGGESAAAEPDWVPGRIDLIKVLSEASGRARRREDAGAYLREVGLKGATVIVDGHNHTSIWRVETLAVDLEHKRSRSSIAGHARIESATGPWAVSFRTFEADATNKLQVAVAVEGLIPRSLAGTIPQLVALRNLDMPVWADAQLDLSSGGEILGGTIAIDAAPGRIIVPGLANPFRIDGAHLALSYSGSARRLDIQPSVLVWGDSRVQFTGSAVRRAQGPDGPGWAYELRSAGGWIASDAPGQRLSIDDWSARGFYALGHGRLELGQFLLRAGGAEVTAQGELADSAGGVRMRLEGKIGRTRAEVFKALWPGALAPRSHAWVQHHLLRGSLEGGTFRLDAGAANKPRGQESISLALEGTDLALAVSDTWPTLEIARAALRSDGHTLEITAPDAAVRGTDGRRLALKGSFTVDLDAPEPRTARVAVEGQGPASFIAELLDKEAFNAWQGSGIASASIEGSVEGQFAITVPLGEEISVRDVVVEGRARLSDGRVKQILGVLEIHGANITVNASDTAIAGSGEMLINGVLAKASWQHVYGVAPDKQPPLRITGTLDNSDRTQLGLDINDLVQGELGLEVIVAQDAKSERHVHVRADLLNAELSLDSVAWLKPRGVASLFEFDVVKGTRHAFELHDVRLVGDNVACEGWMGIGPDRKVREFRLPRFSLNVIGSMEVQGKLRNDNVWEVVAKGPTYDGRDLFRSFFDVEHRGSAGRPAPGLDLRADIDTVVGFSDTRMRNVHMNLQRRANKLVGLDVRGTLEGGKAFAAVVHQEAGPRRLRAEAMDAGQIFRLVGFYPNLLGGEMNLEVYLDGQGAAERTGTLWARDFVILGDPIVSEVLQNADGPPTSRGRQRGVVRERFEFENLRIPFSAGHGQFVMHTGYLNGPLVGATMRGKVDFRAHVLNIGGTYVPLSGLNRALAPVPVLGPLLTGPHGEGVFGITFAIQGSLARPEVIVNPFSLVTPGILREIMQMTPEDPRVLPRERTPAGEPVRGAPDIAGGWAAQTETPAPKRR